MLWLGEALQTNMDLKEAGFKFLYRMKCLKLQVLFLLQDKNKDFQCPGLNYILALNGLPEGLRVALTPHCWLKLKEPILTDSGVYPVISVSIGITLDFAASGRKMVHLLDSGKDRLDILRYVYFSSFEKLRLCPELFSTFINDLDTGLEVTRSEFTDDTKLGGAVDSLRGRKALQRDFNKVGGWTITNCMKFNSGKFWLLCLGWGNRGCAYRLGKEVLESSTTQRDLGLLVSGQ
ncbi:hypothetical protein DUI87_12593 [Hirundo rustica rustica]|uniref:Uncharacterized protein n=1 Tax=Hirundo rustica rustica TaxID=333673 RepID=A0A3M0KIP6_HIRRU|nr:hypothetical protein DUI87_12593 [Hirundo rustica rustica]